MSARFRARRASWIGVALTSWACVSPSAPTVVPCALPMDRLPLVTAECFRSVEGQAHAGHLGSEIGNALSGWRSHPGAAEISIAFAGDGSVAELCTDRVDGHEVELRIPDAAGRIGKLPPAPACLAGHRLDFAWESDDVTSEHVSRAKRECRRRVEKYRRQNDFCYATRRCPVEEVHQRWARADRELRVCMLEKVPIEVHLAGTNEPLYFLPLEQQEPDPDLAVEAEAVCDRLADRESLLACMDQHGWVPVP